MNSETGKIFIADARRSAVVPRGGALSALNVADLAAPVLRALASDQTGRLRPVDYVIMGNALYGGGNPARVCALAAGFDQSVPALTIDSQCCAGLDAITMGAALIRSGQADVVIAGGVESYSRSPIRCHRPLIAGESPLPYDRPPFTPWPDIDPDMIDAAALLAGELNFSRASQEQFAIGSHARALNAAPRLSGEIITIQDQSCDAFTRELSKATCQRLPLIAGGNSNGLTSATIAVEADAAAAVLLVSESAISAYSARVRPVEWLAGQSAGGDPTRPGLAPIAAARSLLHAADVSAAQLSVVEIMEAFAVQAMAFRDALRLRDELINLGGGGLARGHPIGASGAILAVRSFHELQRLPAGATGLAAIAAAGGLGSAALLRA